MCPAHIDSDSSYAEPKSKRLRNKGVKCTENIRTEKKIKVDNKLADVTVEKINCKIKSPVSQQLSVKKSPNKSKANKIAKPPTKQPVIKNIVKLGNGVKTYSTETSKEEAKPCSHIFKESSTNILNSCIQLLVERKQRLNSYVYIAERMILGIKSLDQIVQLMYFWATQNTKASYTEAFTLSERRNQCKLLYNTEQRVIDAHLAAISALGNISAIDETIAYINPSIKSNTTTQIPAVINQIIRNEEKKEIGNNSDLSSLQEHFYYLTSPFVHFNTVTSWNPREIVLFETALCRFGCDFLSISSIVQTKTYKECYTFYAEIYKQTTRYLIFKEFKKYAPWYGT